MRTAKRITTACLTAIMIFQALAPSTEVFAQELDAVMEASVSAARAAGNTARGVQDVVATALQDTDQATSDDAATTPGADAGATEGGDGSTNAGESQDSTTDGTTSGDAPAEGDASQDDAAADEGAADEEQTDDADADAAAQADATYEYSTVDKLRKAIGEANVAIEGDKVTKVTIGTSEDLIKLSNADPAIYQDAALTKGGATGSGLNLCNTVKAADGKVLSFLGLGAPNTPFKGSFDSEISPIVLNRPLFNNVELSADMTLTLTWEGTTSNPIVATTIVGEDHKLTVDLTIAPPDDKTTTVTLKSPLLGEVAGKLALDATYSARANSPLAIDMQSSTGNLGLLVNTLAAHASLTLSGLNGLPESFNGTPAISATADGANAGGLIGEAGDGATVTLAADIDVSALGVAAKNAAGGLIGKATRITLTVGTGNDGEDASTGKFVVKPARAVGSSSAGTYAGGLIGDASFAGDFTIKADTFDFGGGVALSVSNTTNAPAAGGLFGMLDISNGDVIVDGGSYTSTLQNGKDDNSNVNARGNYGGLVGKLWGGKNGTALHAFTVQDDAKVSFCMGSNGQLTYAGGLVGYLGEGGESENVSALVISGATVTCATSGYNSNNGKYGGAVGVVDTNNVLEVRGITVKTSSKATVDGTNSGFAGVVGSSWRGIIKFSGITDLTGAAFAENDHTAQLVYENFNSLIFASGSGSDMDAQKGGKTKWQYKRPTTPVKIDDVYSYGQVIRLGDKLDENLITIDESHQRHFASNLTKTDGGFTLGSADDFAKLAITWQTSGYFSAVNDVTNSNFTSQIPSAKINLSDNIDLSGTGLTGLTKDRVPNNIANVDENGHGFTGSLDGGGHIISLAVGEPYGVHGDKVLDDKDASAGNGKIYRHGRLGLFAQLGSKAVIKNITVGGSLRFDNGVEVHAGSFAATITGNATFTGAVAKAAIACDQTFTNAANVGGIAGSVTGAATVTFEANGNTASAAQATITFPNELMGGATIGGAIGWVNDNTTNVNVTKLTVGGALNVANAARGKIVQAGGLIGSIAQGSNKKCVTITGLSFDEFKMTVGKNGDKLNGAGGLLGYSWGNTIVTIGKDGVNTGVDTYALKTSDNTIVTANNSTEVGGLVYAASGHWIINDYAIDLSKAIVNADKATVLGLLIGRGGRTENSATYGVETYRGLYLENRASWDTAYKVNDVAADNSLIVNNTAINSDNSATSFDEWVGNSTRPSYDKKANSKLIDGEWNTVVSLHTQDGVNDDKLDMSGDPKKDNSYHNRSDFGKNHNTNAWTRYYYNLDKAYAVVGSNSKNSSTSSWMDSPEYLLLWCAYLYAPPAIQGYIIRGNSGIFKGNNIGTDDSRGVIINLEGYSFYPTNPTSNSTVTVKNATITFHYSDIKAEQEGNKKNNEATQHENMHCALIRTHAGDLDVENITLAGTVGPVVNDAGSSSGALVCRYIYGPVKKNNVANVAQITIKGLVLDGLAVDGVTNTTQYAPLLINQIQTLVNFDAKNISVTDSYNNGASKKIAATSLFGKLGVGDKANQVTAKFEKISLPSKKGATIFTHSSLLESFGYATTGTGSADYTFKKADADGGKVTYGSEIDRKGTEYSGKQLWYYDEATYGNVDGLVKVGNKTANVENPVFGDYLPYVYKGKADGSGVQYHEIRVNQRIPKLVTGCGTYGDPYTVKDAAEMNAIANYVNNQTALDGWEVTITTDQSQLCTRRNDGKTDYEATYVYKQANGTEKKWEKKTGDTSDPSDTLSDEMMHRYIQSAYYSIEPDGGDTITLDGASFGGFGNKANPFRGVIVGNLKGDKKATIKIENNKGSLRGLIPYSYGSVVRDLNIDYVNASASITYSAKDADGVPTAFFGGVIGCILGGDNIIDGVVVNNPNSGSTMYGFTVAGGSHLVPIGGYVGAIAGGGVIFRNTGDSWRGGTKKKKFIDSAEGSANYHLYDNPYVGRVIDGYAFSEGCTVDVDNGDANYKINELVEKSTPCVTTTAAGGSTATRVTPTNKQGLLVLSAIINSGAASGGVSLAYEGGTYDTKTSYKFGNALYGKARNATYEHVGKPANVGSDFTRSIADDQTSPGTATDGSNLPYLVKNYADAATGSLCASSGVELQLASEEPYDMTSYGKGFTGLSGRYVSNACVSSKGIARDCIVPRIACINGNGETIKVGSKKGSKVYEVTEYTDDDYKVAGVGALFSMVTLTSQGVSSNANADMVTDLKFEDCDVELTTINTTDDVVDGQGGDEVGIGLLAGVTANNDDKVSGIYRKVTMDGCKVAGAKNVGGLLGSSGYCSRSTATNSTSEMVSKSGKASPVKLYDCSYANMDVIGGCNVGGYVGKVGTTSSCGVWETDKNLAPVASNSNVKATGAGGLSICAGGIFGWTQCSISVNTKLGTNTVETTGVAKISNVTVESPVSNLGKLPGAGGFIGRADYGKNSIYNLSITATEEGRYIGSNAANSGNLNNIGGCIGYIISGGGSSYRFDGCTFSGLHIAAKGNWTGGLIGNFTSDYDITCNAITAEGLTLDSQSAGGLFGKVDRVVNVNITNSKIASSTFCQASSGGISGEGKGKFHLANVLLDSNTFNKKDQQGILLGRVDTSNLGGYELYAAGVSVKLTEGQTNATMPALIRASESSKIGEVNKKSYIAFGSYKDTPAAPKGKTLYGADAADSTTAAVSPCVTTSPVSSLSVQTASGDAGQTRYLFGDGVNVSDESTIKDTASTIKDDAGKNVTGRYTYTNIGGIDKDGAYQKTSSYSSSSVRKFSANNDAGATQLSSDPNVLVLSGNDSDTVKDYLNILTNGGYSDALRLNADGSHVSATVDVFQLENGKFVKQTNVTDRALDVKGSGSSLSVSANSNWDNGKNRFNLLTVTFTEAGQSYRVMVPIIVKRVLEINFTATYSEGSNFNSDDYSSKYNKHVLISSGETMTGYLTWTYNKAYTQETEYGWDTHLASGGDMRPLNKRIEFGGLKGALPVGTQLTLVDTAHNNKEYHYTVPEGGAATSVALTDFVDSSEKSHYTEQWLSETMGATTTEADDGTWVKLTDEELTDGKNAKKTEAELIGIAGAKIDGNYYRLKTDADKEGKFYNLTVPKKGANEQPKSESFYLVVRTPKNSANVNGYTGTSVKTSVNTHINYVLRKDEVKDSLDSHENTASTYSIATNFQHNLVDNRTLVDGKTSVNQMAVKGTTYPLEMDVRDTITFGEQEYTGTDALYYQLDSSLVNYVNGSAAGAHGYPTGTQGTYSFYVTVGGKYYTWNGSGWDDPVATEPPVVQAKEWSSTTGGDMSLVLADASGKAIDLSGIREKAKEHGNQFTITMRANLTMTEPACQAGIIASQNSGNDKYTKPNYRAHLSTNDDTLSTSSNSAYNDGGAGYYRMDVGSSTIALEASKKSQLGINIDDLKSADGEIALVGTYDLSKLAGAEAMISNADMVTYTLSLQQRQDTGKYAEVSDISEYIKVDSLSDGGNTWHDNGNSYIFTDNKGADGKFATRDGNRPVFARSFRAKVNTDVEGKGQTYANYRLVLTAHMSGGTVNDTPVNVSNLDGYSHSDYVTYTLSRINTKGIPHGTKTN